MLSNDDDDDDLQKTADSFKPATSQNQFLITNDDITISLRVINHH